MRFHVEFTYQPKDREKLFHFLDAGALKSEKALKIVGAWVAVETGTGYAVIDTDDAAQLYSLCTNWAEYGTVNVTPILGVKDLPQT